MRDHTLDLPAVDLVLSNTRLVNITLTLIRTVVSSIPSEMCVWVLNGTVARWLCVLIKSNSCPLCGV